jgi:hypothetical protein
MFVGLQLVLLAALSLTYINRGPIEAARALSRQPDFQERLVVVDGSNDSVGGHYYLRRKELDVFLVERERLAAWLDAERPSLPLYLLVCREPLEPGAVGAAGGLEEIGSYSEWFNIRSRSRRFVYRLERRVQR